MTKWKTIDKFKNYEVSTNGEVRNIKTGKVLKPWMCRKGYLYVSLSNGLGKTNCSVHSLVAEAFIPNPENKPTVDHINRVKSDNVIANLRWATLEEQRENSNSGRPKTPVIAIKDGVELQFESQRDCANALNLHKNDVSACVRGKQKTTKGYVIRYLERSEVNAS